MARSGLTDIEIMDAVNALQTEGAAVTVQTVRSRLGTGSFTTIQAALERWRKTRTESANLIPEMPEKVASLARLLWGEAWSEASRSFETEKTAFAEERQRFEALRVEMTNEISRLETELTAAHVSRRTLEERLRVAEQASQELELALKKEEGLRQGLRQETERLRQECATLRDEVKTSLERASRAEGRLEEAKRGADAIASNGD